MANINRRNMGADVEEGGESYFRPQRMDRGVSQLLFNYLPDRTIDWEDGAAVVQLTRLRLSSMLLDADASTVLTEIWEYLERWRRSGGLVDQQFRDPTREFENYVVGRPERVDAQIFRTTMVCRRCHRLHFVARSRELASPNGLKCRHCKVKSLRQFPYVFVHGCGELASLERYIPVVRTSSGEPEAIHVPIKCTNCGEGGDLSLSGSARSERIRDLKIVCLRCNSTVMDQLSARCHQCLRRIKNNDGQALGEISDEGDAPTLVTQIKMRMTSYRASEAYYPQTLTMLRFNPMAVLRGDNPEVSLLAGLLPPNDRPEGGNNEGLTLQALSSKLEIAIKRGDNDEILRIRDQMQNVLAELDGRPVDTPVATSDRTVLTPNDPEHYADLKKMLTDSITFREVVTTHSALDEIERRGGPASLLVDRCAQTQRQMGINEALIVEDLPVTNTTFGYTRRAFRPTYEEDSRMLPTQIRSFPPLDRGAARILESASLAGKIPILARQGEHEGIFLSLNPERVVRWLEENGIVLPLPGEAPAVRIMHAIEPVDRFHDNIWSEACAIRRYVFGLVHSFSHVAMRAASRYAGLERTSIGEYIFLPLLGTVIFDSSSSFQLGGMTMLARDHLLSFFNSISDEGITCLYDTECIDHRGACHGCVHSPEISCRYFNHGLSRAFLIGGHAPWASSTSDRQIIGYWELDE